MKSEIDQLVDNLFRHSSGKILSVLIRIFGVENIELSEDVVQDSFVEAIKQWTYKGIPENPTGWLFKVAKNKALNIVNREKYKRQYSSELQHLLTSDWTAEPVIDHLFSDSEILDDQLRMMFICCHHDISSDSQIALILKTLCGFSITEIANAFLTNDDNIHKRLVRARKKIRENKLHFEFPDRKDLEQKLNTILETVYLLFNEGYSASTGDNLIKFDICEEAIRLAKLISEHHLFKNNKKVYALLSLMQLNASRFKGRQDSSGNIITLEFQDRTLWDKKLMNEGYINLERSSLTSQISLFHVLAAISANHCSAPDFDKTNWTGILSLYQALIVLDNSPVVHLNYTIAISKVYGAGKALIELKKIGSSDVMTNNHLYYSTLAEFYIELHNYKEALLALEKAYQLAPLNAERSFTKKRIEFCKSKI